jgi:predicted nucleotidyltransferase
MKLTDHLKALNNELRDEGFVIDGVFGSYARGEQSEASDIDLLYHLDEKFYAKYGGFAGFKRLDEIKRLLAQRLQKEVDLAPANNLSQTAKKYILGEVVYV